MAKQYRGGKRAGEPIQPGDEFSERWYKTILNYSGIEFIEKLEGGNNNTPMISHSKDAIYGIVHKDDNQKQQVTVYKNYKKLYDIDFDHDHSNKKDFQDGHVHYYIDGKRQEEYKHLNKRQQKIAKRYLEGVDKIGR